MRHIEMYRMRHIFLSGAYVAIPAILIFFQPNFGSVIVLLSIWIGILLISGIKIRHFIVLILIFLILFVFSGKRLWKIIKKKG
jgi:rod shape determining protein RodA